ncbi:MAG: hypothetical protein GX418_10955 [Clostridiales bacterium]|nr:hypothetical protein [Clostridiales bacterium]
MDATATPGAWKRFVWQPLAFAALLGCVYLFAPLAFVLAFLLPLAVCPAMTEGKTWFALSVPLAPSLGYLLAGGDPIIGAMLPLFPFLCLPVVSFRRRLRISLVGETLLVTAAFVLSALAMLVRLSELINGPLFPGIAEYVVDTIRGSLYSGAILYRLTNAGVLTLPDAFANAMALQLGDLVWLHPALQTELLNMLRLRLNEAFTQWIPALLMQGGLLVGLLSTLAAERARARRDGTVPPAFRQVRLSRREQGYVLVLCLGVVATSFSDQPVTALVCLLMYAAFSAVCQIQGAAVMVALLTRRHPGRAPLYGLLAALLYALFPLSLFILGVADQFVNLRAAGKRIDPQNQEEEKP